jgi:hypothetical protein
VERELVEKVRGLYDPDTGSGHGLLKLAHPEIEIRPMVSWPGVDSTEFRGPEGLNAYFAELGAAFGRFRYDLRALTDHGDALVADVLITAEGRESGITTSVPSFQVIRIEDGLVRSIEGYATREDAEKAVQSPPA